MLSIQFADVSKETKGSFAARSYDCFELFCSGRRNCLFMEVTLNVRCCCCRCNCYCCRSFIAGSTCAARAALAAAERLLFLLRSCCCFGVYLLPAFLAKASLKVMGLARSLCLTWRPNRCCCCCCSVCRARICGGVGSLMGLLAGKTTRSRWNVYCRMEGRE